MSRLSVAVRRLRRIVLARRRTWAAVCAAVAVAAALQANTVRPPARTMVLTAAHDLPGEAWALQNLAWRAFSQGEHSVAEARLETSAATFGMKRRTGVPAPKQELEVLGIVTKFGR